MLKLLTGGAMLAALAFAGPAMAGEKPSGTGHCVPTAAGDCVDKDPPLGWNVGQPYACQTTYTGGNVFQYSYWTNGEYWWVENIPSLGDLLVQGCDAGGNQFVEVINATTGGFDAVQNRIPGH